MINSADFCFPCFYYFSTSFMRVFIAFSGFPLTLWRVLGNIGASSFLLSSRRIRSNQCSESFLLKSWCRIKAAWRGGFSLILFIYGRWKTKAKFDKLTIYSVKKMHHYLLQHGIYANSTLVSDNLLIHRIIYSVEVTMWSFAES